MFPRNESFLAKTENQRNLSSAATLNGPSGAQPSCGNAVFLLPLRMPAFQDVAVCLSTRFKIYIKEFYAPYKPQASNDFREEYVSVLVVAP